MKPIKFVEKLKKEINEIVDNDTTGTIKNVVLAIDKSGYKPLATITANEYSYTVVGLSERTLNELIVSFLEYVEELQPIEDSDEPEDYCIAWHNIKLIDEIINNTLQQSTDITPQQTDTLLKLQQLKSMLVSQF